MKFSVSSGRIGGERKEGRAAWNMEAAADVNAGGRRAAAKFHRAHRLFQDTGGRAYSSSSTMRTDEASTHDVVVVGGGVMGVWWPFMIFGCLCYGGIAIIPGTSA